MMDWSAIVPQLTEDDYGRPWPAGTHQITKELVGFAANGRANGFRSRFEHGLNLIRLIWPNEVKLFVKWKHHETGEEVIIWNHWFLLIFMRLCNGKRTAITGCSSSGKTYAVAVYFLLMFMSKPTGTMIMVSTTAGSDAERRLWGEIKALFAIQQQIYPIGTLIDYIKTIAFDPARELEGRRDVKERDIRNGLMLIPIPKGSEGEEAVGKVIGTKNEQVLWGVDELPNMMDDVLRPEGNLESNKFFQLVVMGNAAKTSDPHGRACEPKDGFASISEEMEEWEGIAGTQVINCHGPHSPNNHEAVDTANDDKLAYPFPFLCTPAYLRRIALLYGRGNPELGERTVDYCRFGKGFWPGGDAVNTILTEEMARNSGASDPNVAWGAKPKRMVAGFDCGFTAGGDSNDLTFGEIGEDSNGATTIKVSNNSVQIIAEAGGVGRPDFRKSIARQVVEECRKKGVQPSDFGMDINADGGLMMQAIMQEWKSMEVSGLSSLEPSDDEKFDNRVTQYWFQASLAVTTGRMRGFGLDSRYAKDLFARRYEPLGKGRVKVEKKLDMKKRIKRSPDAGDSFCYMIQMAIRAGFTLDQPNAPQSTEDGDDEMDEMLQHYFGRSDPSGDEGYFDSSFEAEEAEFASAFN